MVRVSESELEHARMQLGELEGMWTDLAAAAPVAAAIKLAQRGDVPTRTVVVPVVTEHGAMDGSAGDGRAARDGRRSGRRACCACSPCAASRVWRSMAVATNSHRNYIAGEWVDSESGEQFENHNPATGELLGSFPRSTAADADRAVAAAHEAYASWRLHPAPKRAEILFRVAELLRDRKPELSRLMTQEMGKVLAEAGGDVQEGIDMTYYMAGEGRRMFGQTVPAEMPDKFAMSVRQPMGVVAVITPFNFPMAIPTWKLMPALVTGNTAVFKPAHDTPLLGEMLVEIFEEAGLPKGVLNIVHGGGSTVGQRLIEHPDVKVVTFTGSKETGIHVARTGAETLKRIHLELGGKNAIIVMDDADLDNAVEGILWSAFGTSGQRCTAASRVIVHERVYDRLASKLVAAGRAAADRQRPRPRGRRRAADQPGGARQGLDRYTGIARDEGAEILTGGEHYTKRRGRVLLPADRLRPRGARHAGRHRGDLRAVHGAHPVPRPRRCDRDLKRGSSTASRARSTPTT